MKALIHIVVLIPFLAIAQPSDVLLEACNAMQDAAKRLECLKAAVGSSAMSQASSKALENVRRAFGDMNSSLDIGISYRDYQSAILDLSKAVGAYKREAVSADQKRVRLLDEALEIYSDARIFWEKSIGFYARRDNNLSYAGGLPVGLNGLDWLVSKYQLSTSRADLLGFHAGLPVSTTRSQLWKLAQAKAEAALSEQEKTPSVEHMNREILDQLWLPYEMGNASSENMAVEKIAKGSACTKTPMLGRSDFSTARGRQYSWLCDDGSALHVLCSLAICRAVTNPEQPPNP